ncbi:hypothetical protein M2322_003811 [Rhodoblastus acidophilus]|uniref:DUF2946 family protein n=1 Tax=Rhodoblastus acidophilus TaxID=1074 RepID=UPI002224EFC9|nr:hypothetical protein [Rhodoblastus acidophilus]MCW2318244.1 hypothetical protein [Rhodoblastus acidophilus]
MRRFLAIVPLFLAALLAQVYAPVGASLAMGVAGPGLAPICASHATPDQNQPKAPDACCDLCAFVSSGAAPVPPVAAPFAFQRAEPHRVVWVFRTLRGFGDARRGAAQARAPPFAS